MSTQRPALLSALGGGDPPGVDRTPLTGHSVNGHHSLSCGDWLTGGHMGQVYPIRLQERLFQSLHWREWIQGSLLPAGFQDGTNNGLGTIGILPATTWSLQTAANTKTIRTGRWKSPSPHTIVWGSGFGGRKIAEVAGLLAFLFSRSQWGMASPTHGSLSLCPALSHSGRGSASVEHGAECRPASQTVCWAALDKTFICSMSRLPGLKKQGS